MAVLAAGKAPIALTCADEDPRDRRGRHGRPKTPIAVRGNDRRDVMARITTESVINGRRDDRDLSQ